MVRFCNIIDIEKIITLGKLINNNFEKVNNLEDIINNKEIIGYYDNNNLVGFLIFNKNYEVLDLLYVVVDPIYRNKSIGSKLVEYLIKNTDYERVLLEVRCDNVNAIKLYKKYNFKIINIRKNYYENNDAYVMELIKWKMYIF